MVRIIFFLRNPFTLAAFQLLPLDTLALSTLRLSLLWYETYKTINETLSCCAMTNLIQNGFTTTVRWVNRLYVMYTCSPGMKESLRGCWPVGGVLSVGLCKARS